MKGHDSLDELLKSYFSREVEATDPPQQPQHPGADPIDDVDGTDVGIERAVQQSPWDGETDFPLRHAVRVSPPSARRDGIADVVAKALIAAAAAVCILLPLRGADMAGPSAKRLAEVNRRVNTAELISSGLLSAQRVLRTRFAIDGSADHTNHSGGEFQ